MIFVTVGTHEQPFNRLVKEIDRLAETGEINEKVIIQTGYSTYEPKYCEWKALFSYKDMVRNVAEAGIVITHGGPSSYIMPLQIGKIPIVVPRMKQYGEHVNDHQVEFARTVAERQGNIIVVEDIKEIGKAILNFDSIIKEMPAFLASNNAKFNEKLEREVDDIFKRGKK